MHEGHDAFAIGKIPPRVTRAVLNHAVADFQVRFRAIVEFEPDLPGQHHPVVDRARGMHAWRPVLHAVGHAGELRVELMLARFEVDVGFRSPRQVARGWKRHDTEFGTTGIRKERMRSYSGILVARRKLRDAGGSVQTSSMRNRGTPLIATLRETGPSLTKMDFPARSWPVTTRRIATSSSKENHGEMRRVNPEPAGAA